VSQHTDQDEKLYCLLAAVAMQDRQAFRALYDATSAQLFGFALRVLHREALAEEAVRDAFLSTWHAAPGYQMHLAPPLTWMVTIVRNKALHIRRRTYGVAGDGSLDIEAADGLADPSTGPADPAQMSRNARALARCMETLASRQRQAIGMAYLHGLSHGEVAARLDLPVGTVRTWIRRGLDRLRECLARRETMTRRGFPVLRDRLAAEYALGTLRGGARRRFETWLRDDPALRDVVAGWQERLAVLAELDLPLRPPARVWAAIERGLEPAAIAPRTPWWQFWHDDVARPWGVLAVGACAAWLVLVVSKTMPDIAPQSRQVAALSDTQSHTALVVTADTTRGRLDVRVAEEVRVPTDRTLQLWAITRTGKPRSLGILPGNRSTDLALDARATDPDVALLAISLEPKSGSPDPTGPTGPVLYKGSWARL
jgi:RNA polymerase sigma factor (sigma-70 family)